jgi:hypothetical protein
MGWFDFFKEIAHIIILPLVLLEGIFAYFRIREERKKKQAEKKYSQHIMNKSHTSLSQIVTEIRHVGDLIKHRARKKELIDKIKNITDDLNNELYILLLFSSDNPIIILQGLGYFKDRREALTLDMLALLKKRLHEFPVEDVEMLESHVNEFLNSKKN